jgi:hypothetical protein
MNFAPAAPEVNGARYGKRANVIGALLRPAAR